MALHYRQQAASTQTGNLSLVVFDMDGTLLDTSEDLVTAANATREDLGLSPLPPELIQSCMGDALLPLLENIFADAPDRLPSAIPLFQQHYRSHVLTHCKPYPGVTELLTILKQSTILCGVLSNKPSELVRIPLYHFNLSNRLDFIYGGDSFSVRKPSPKPLKRIMVHFHSPPHRTVMVGDTFADIRSGCDAGARTIAVTYGFGLPEDLEKAGPDHMVSDTNSLLHALSHMHGRSLSHQDPKHPVD